MPILLHRPTDREQIVFTGRQLRTGRILSAAPGPGSAVPGPGWPETSQQVMRELRRAVSPPGGAARREQAYPEGEQARWISLTMYTPRAARVNAAGVAGSARSGSGRSSPSSQRWCSRTPQVTPRRQGGRRPHRAWAERPLRSHAGGERVMPLVQTGVSAGWRTRLHA